MSCGALLLVGAVGCVSAWREIGTVWGFEGVSADGRTLTIRYVRGDRDCFHFDHVEKREADQMVTVKVFLAMCRTGGTDIYTRRLIEGCSEQPAPRARELQDFAIAALRTKDMTTAAVPERG